MARLKLEKDYLLSAQGIADCIDRIGECGESCRVNRRMLLMSKLSIEEVLINFQEHFGAEQAFTLQIRKSFGYLNIIIVLGGEIFDPLLYGKENAEEQAYILGRLDILPRYRYIGGKNQISTSLRAKTKLSYPAVLGAAMLLGILVGLSGSLLPPLVLESETIVLSALSDAIFGLMKMSSMPVIFLCVVYGITQSGSISSFKSSGIKLLMQLFLTMALMLLALIVVAIPFFGLKMQESSFSLESLELLIHTLFSILPDNIFSPFLNGDSMKVILLGIVFGCALLALGQKAGMVQEFSRQLSDACSLIMEWIGKLIPLLVFTLLALNIWKGTFSAGFAGAWKIFAVYLVISALFVLADAVLTARARKLPLSDVLHSIAGPGLNGLISASSMFCYIHMENALKKDLKVPQQDADIGIPLSIAFFHPSLILFGVLLLYYAAQSAVSVNGFWLLSFFLICFVTSVATPPVSGGSTALLALMFAALGVDESLLALACPIYVLLDYPNTAVRVMMTVLEIARLRKNGSG